MPFEFNVLDVVQYAAHRFHLLSVVQDETDEAEIKPWAFWLAHFSVRRFTFRAWSFLLVAHPQRMGCRFSTFQSIYRAFSCRAFDSPTLQSF